MNCHASKSLNLLQQIITEGSDSSSGQDWVDTEQGADSGQGDTDSGGRGEESHSTADSKLHRQTDKTDSITHRLTDKTDGRITGQTSTDRQIDRIDTQNNSDFYGDVVTICVMDKMGNTVGGSLESEEEINRKYEQFLKGGQIIDNDDEHGREVVLDKIEEESSGDPRPVKVKVVRERSELRREEDREQSDSRSKVENHSQFENKSRESEDSGVRKKTKLRKKKRRVKKAFVVENGDHEDGTLEPSEQESVNQENCDQQNARHSKKEESTDQDSVSDRQEIMSDQGPATQNQKRRKLVKRTQIRKFRSLDINPNLFYQERLQQKYEELKQLVETGVSQHEVSRQYLRQMEVLRQQYASVSHGIPPSGRAALRDVSRHSLSEWCCLSLYL